MNHTADVADTACGELSGLTLSPGLVFASGQSIAHFNRIADTIPEGFLQLRVFLVWVTFVIRMYPSSLTGILVPANIACESLNSRTASAFLNGHPVDASCMSALRRSTLPVEPPFDRTLRDTLNRAIIDLTRPLA